MKSKQIAMNMISAGPQRFVGTHGFVGQGRDGNLHMMGRVMVKVLVMMMMKRRRTVMRMESLMGAIRKPYAEICHLLFLGICMFMPSNAFGSYEYDSV